MIHVPRGRVPRPADLVVADVREEVAAAKLFYRDRGNAKKSFAFRLYNLPGVKGALYDLFLNKCAYCESLMPTQPADVEHYRPKGGVAHNGTLLTPGYYWLAADWDNLLPSCIDCNRERYQTFPDEPPHLSGKANRFPLEGARRPARLPHLVAREKPLLIDPCREPDPDQHLAFIEKEGQSLVVPAAVNGPPSAKGKASIQAYGLLRQTLVQARTDRLLILKDAWNRYEYAKVNEAKDPQDPNHRREVVQAQEALARHAHPKSPYCGMARQFLRQKGGL